MKEITEEKLDKYFNVTEKALDKVKKSKIKIPENVDLKKVREDFLDMAQRYFDDAKYFKKKGDYVTAFAALNYAHGFLDAGARLKVFNVKDAKLFAAD